ncbi:type VI secretion protein [Pandoraea horticolens]|uniref:Type VI secretion protein n=1 Tax=Pandoraea horticolens TaxID=2508298 RepID=A0A5E4YTE1_9BURK|nr:Hcp family type VI secretion system effector [Pandoraea horticolens]VVE52164.1 type VI secretion protein [Pandoraea horticolens]
MPMPCYLSLTGDKQGKIEGSCSVRGHEGKILVQAMKLRVELPKNEQTGAPSSVRRHVGMSIVKEIDKSSPKLFQALCSGEQMSEVLLEFWRFTSGGTEEKYYTIKLQNAAVFEAEDWVPNVLLPENEKLGHMESIGFSYQKIVWTWIKDGIESEDSWTAPR